MRTAPHFRRAEEPRGADPGPGALCKSGAARRTEGGGCAGAERERHPQLRRELRRGPAAPQRPFRGCAALRCPSRHLMAQTARVGSLGFGAVL